MTDHARTPSARRERLWRIFNKVKEAPTSSDLIELEKILTRVAPERPSGLHFIGMQAGTLNKDNLDRIRASNGFVCAKVDGIGMLAAMSNPAFRTKSSTSTAIDANRIILISRNGTFVVNNVVLPFRNGPVLMDGELCLRKKQLSSNEHDRLERFAKESTLIGNDYLDPDDGNENADGNYELCYAAYDLALEDNSTSVATRNKDTVRVLEPAQRFQRLLAIMQCGPFTDTHVEQALQLAMNDLGDRPPAIKLFFKMPWLNREFHLAHRMIAPILRGIPLDGLIFLANKGPYMVCESNPDLLKYKAWKSNTADLVVVRNRSANDPHAYRFFVVKKNNEARDVSGVMWLGDTESERQISLDTLALEDKRLADGGDTKTPMIFEFEPSLADSDAFFALRTAPFESKGRRLLAAASMLRWRATGVVRTDRRFPNAEANFFGIVDALLNHVSIDDIKAHLHK